MANAEHLRILKEGVAVWNKWREDAVHIDPDLSGADLTCANLSHSNLSGADLIDANLSDADLRDANLIGANLDGASLRDCDLSGANLTGADLIDANLSDADLCDANLSRTNLSDAKLPDADLSRADLTHADLSHADLSRADLTRADLSHANLNDAVLTDAVLGNPVLSGANLIHAVLSGVNLSGVNLSGADLKRANLIQADLSGADLSRANLIQADLSDANLSGANLCGANLHNANLNGANLDNSLFADARLLHTTFASTSLKTARGLGACEHAGPSFMDYYTMVNSGQLPDVFLRGCGFADELIHFLPSLWNRPIQFHSCFISYSHADKSFARKLHEALQSRGIRCWLDEHQLLPSDDLHEEIDRDIRLWDKLLLCSSEASLTSWWVDGEINRAFQKEAQFMNEHGRKVVALIPLNLDGFMFGEACQSGKRAEIKSRVVASFIGWKNNDDKFDAELENVIKALRADAGARDHATE
jgi:uncharacterized protein YjbI with pentapeptide repeats